MFQLLKSKFNNRAKVRKYIGCAYAFFIFFFYTPPLFLSGKGGQNLFPLYVFFEWLEESHLFESLLKK